MNIDFHTHGRLAKKMPFDPTYTDNLFRKAKKSGLDAVCLTEHFNTMEYNLIYQYMDEYYEKTGDFYLFEGLCIIPGMEVDCQEGGHLLMLGKSQAMLDFNLQLEPYQQKGGFLDAQSILNLADKYGAIKGIAHPFRPGQKVHQLPMEILQQFDFVDLNGKDIATEGYDWVCHQTEAFAGETGLKMVGGSDTHQALQYGVVWTEFNREIHTVEELRRAILLQEYEIKVSQEAPYYVNMAGTLKKALKEIHRLGGNYIPFADCRQI